MDKRNTSVVDELPYGVYIAKTSDGKVIANEHGDVLNIVAKKGDQKRLAQLKQAARHYGFENITWEFRSGARRVSEEDFNEQLQRQRDGLVADPYDLGVLIDEHRKGMSGQ